MRPLISRREMLATPLALAGCATGNPYFGNTAVPHRQSLTFALGLEPETLDPAKSAGGFELYVLPSLFEGLITYHPRTLEPAAALATHYEVDENAMRFTFYLRGHPNPRGSRLPNTDTLANQYRNGEMDEDFSRGHRSPPDHVPARWSDSRVINAPDFVYSWRRLIDPSTAAPYAYLLQYVRNAREIQEGKRAPDDLGVRALDPFTFQVDLASPTPFFLALVGQQVFAATPQHAIVAARHRRPQEDWTSPRNIVTSGPFTLKAWRPYEYLQLGKNPEYYEAGLVALQDLRFLSGLDTTAIVNLYKTGEAHAMPGERLTPLFTPLLEGKLDFHIAPAVFSVWSWMNTKRPPFDDVLVRYAVNMAVDKTSVVNVCGAGRTENRAIVPPMPGYQPPEQVLVTVNGRTYNVLAHDPQGARALMAASRYGSGAGRNGTTLTIDYLSASLPLDKLFALILREQLREVLNIDLRLVTKEFNVALQSIFSLEYNGLASGGDWGTYVDPAYFLDIFVSGSARNGSGWSDPQFDVMLAEANSTLDPAARMRRLSKCERYMLAAMPVLPMFNNTWSYLQKPFVRGLTANALDLHPFKYAWIDTKWRPS